AGDLYWARPAADASGRAFGLRPLGGSGRARPNRDRRVAVARQHLSVTRLRLGGLCRRRLRFLGRSRLGLLASDGIVDVVDEGPNACRIGAEIKGSVAR